MSVLSENLTRFSRQSRWFGVQHTRYKRRRRKVVSDNDNDSAQRATKTDALAAIKMEDYLIREYPPSPIDKAAVVKNRDSAMRLQLLEPNRKLVSQVDYLKI